MMGLSGCDTLQYSLGSMGFGQSAMTPSPYESVQLQGLVERILVLELELTVMVKSVVCYYHLVGLPEPDVPVVFHILV
jgi:hypothetical protein